MIITNVDQGEMVPVDTIGYWFQLGRSTHRSMPWFWSFGIVLGKAHSNHFEFWIDWRFEFRLPIWYDRYDKCIRIAIPFI